MKSLRIATASAFSLASGCMISCSIVSGLDPLTTTSCVRECDGGARDAARFSGDADGAPPFTDGGNQDDGATSTQDDSSAVADADSSAVADADSSAVDDADSSAVSNPDSDACSPLIDDMESGGPAILPICGRVGFWFTYNDMSAGGVQTPAYGAMFTDSMIVPPRGTSTMAARTTGRGFTGYGAGMGFDLNKASGSLPKNTYDASMYSGVTFWVRGSASGPVRFNIVDLASDPSGNICSGTGSNSCYDRHGSPLTLTTGWQKVSFAWSDLPQQGFGYAEPNLDTKHLLGMQFDLAAPTGAFDLWIDDIAFLP